MDPETQTLTAHNSVTGSRLASEHLHRVPTSEYRIPFIIHTETESRDDMSESYNTTTYSLVTQL